MNRIRLYPSALNDVRYVYGGPVAFSSDPELLKKRHADLEAAQKRAAQ